MKEQLDFLLYLVAERVRLGPTHSVGAFTVTHAFSRQVVSLGISLAQCHARFLPARPPMRLAAMLPVERMFREHNVLALLSVLRDTIACYGGKGRADPDAVPVPPGSSFLVDLVQHVGLLALQASGWMPVDSADTPSDNHVPTLRDIRGAAGRLYCVQQAWELQCRHRTADPFPPQPALEPEAPAQPALEPETPAQPVLEPEAPVQPVLEPEASAQPVLEPVLEPEAPHSRSDAESAEVNASLRGRSVATTDDIKGSENLYDITLLLINHNERWSTLAHRVMWADAVCVRIGHVTKP